MYNSNYSERVMLTGCTVFPEGVRELNLIKVDQAATQLNYDRLRHTLQQYEINGRRVFDLSDPTHRARLDSILSDLELRVPESAVPVSKIETCESVRRRTSGLTLVTDDNMGEEWP